jgi:hypothetical protein
MSINLNSAIYTLLTTNTGFTAVVGTKVYPIIAPNDTQSPYVVIERDFSVEYTRDGQSHNESNLEITVLGTSYNQSVSIAVIIDNILNFYSGSSSGIEIKDIRLISCTETYQDESFIQKLIYSMKNN